MNTLPPTSMRLDMTGFVTQIFRVTIPEGHTVEDLKNPPYWVHHWAAINVGDYVRCLATDASFDIVLVAVDKVRGAVKFRIDRAYVNDAAAEAARKAREERDEIVPHDGKTDLPAVRFTQSRKWHVLGYDNQPVAEGLMTKAQAEAAKEKYLERTKAA